MRILRPAIILALVALLFYLGGVARDQLGIEFSAESIQAWVASLGWTGPATYMLLVIFRHFLALPAAIVLPAGGAVFGTTAGTVMGASGILITAWVNFGLGRGIARDWIRVEPSSRAAPIIARIEAAGPPVIGFVTAHPLAPMTAFHWAAGASTIALVPYTIAVALGAIVRSFVLSFFGSTLFDIGSPRFWLASAVSAALALLPFAHGPTRRRILGREPYESD